MSPLMQVRFCVGEQEQNFIEVERTRKGIAELRKKMSKMNSYHSSLGLTEFGSLVC